MKIIKILLLTGLLLVADVGFGFTSVNLYAAETTEVLETEVLETEVSETEETETAVSQVDLKDLIAGDDEKAPSKSVGKANMVPVYGSDLVDGTYDIEVESSSSMFRIVKALLTVDGDEMSAVITLSGKGYIRLFMGTGIEAVEADEAEYVDYVEDEDGAYTFEIAVEALDMELECTGFSKRKEKWYDHQILFDASSLEQDALLITLPDYDAQAETASDETEGADADTDEEMTQVSEIMEQERTSLADGEYLVAVTLSGGSGKATVTSPAAVTVADGLATAQLEWSSANYDYMIVNGEKYLPVNTEGNSVFSIPVLCFNREMTVTADTTAMSTPHEIEYTLVFDESSAETVSGGEASDAAQSAEGFDLRLMFLIVLAVMSAAAVAAYAQKKN